MKKELKKIFAIDYRSVMLFRMGVALCLLWDTFERLRDAKVFLSNSGVISLATYERYHAVAPGFSIYSWLASDNWPVFLLWLTVVLAVPLFLGVYPRIAAIPLWFLNVSVHQRNPLDLFGGDTLLQACLFWLMFVPSRPAREGEENFTNGISIAAFIQIAVIYISAGWQKNGADWHDGTAAYYAVSIGMYGTATGDWLRQWGGLLKYATFFILYLERLGWILFFIPSKASWTRILAFFLLAGMHFTFALTLRLYFFAYLDIALLCLLIPTDFWHAIKWRPNIRLSAMAAPLWLSTLATFFIVCITLINLQSPGVILMPAELDRAERVFRLQQNWALFAPNPFHFSHWMVIQAEDASGKKEIVKLHGFGGSSFLRPDFVVDTYPTLDWLRFSPILTHTQDIPATMRNFGRFVCHAIRDEEKKDVEKFNVFVVRDMIHLDPAIQSPLHIDRVFSGDCRKKDFNSFAINW